MATVLIVENDPTLLRLTTELLRDEDFMVVAATTGEEALRCLTEQRPDLIVMDLLLSEMSGVQLGKRIAEEGWGIPILVVSGAQDLEVRASEFGAAAVMSKPFDIDRFVNTVRDLAGASAGSPS
jgi:DNA-binding response OmpR family regulator